MDNQQENSRMRIASETNSVVHAGRVMSEEEASSLEAPLLEAQKEAISKRDG